MSNFDDTFNIIVGVQNYTFDWFDNPYISPNVYDLDDTWNNNISSTIKLTKCTDE